MNLSSNEKILIKLGQTKIASLMQQLRMQNPYAEGQDEFYLWNDQCQLNLPLLLSACLYLDDFCKKKKKHRVLFSARDTCLWMQLFTTLFPNYESIYYHTSRHTYFFPSTSFIEYVRSVYHEETVIVDLCGSGESVDQFFKKHLGIKPATLYLLGCKRRRPAVFSFQEPTFDIIEQLNYDLVGALFDVEKGIPKRAPVEYDINFVIPSHACIKKAVSFLPNFQSDPFDVRVVKKLMRVMSQGIHIAKCMNHAIYHLHVQSGDSIKHMNYVQSSLKYEPESTEQMPLVSLLKAVSVNRFFELESTSLKPGADANTRLAKQDG